MEWECAEKTAPDFRPKSFLDKPCVRIPIKAVRPMMKMASKRKSRMYKNIIAPPKTWSLLFLLYKMFSQMERGENTFDVNKKLRSCFANK